MTRQKSNGFAFQFSEVFHPLIHVCFPLKNYVANGLTAFLSQGFFLYALTPQRTRTTILVIHFEWSLK